MRTGSLGEEQPLSDMHCILGHDVSGRLSCDVPGVEAEAYPALVRELADRFGLEQAGERVAGAEVIFQEYRHGAGMVGLEWDVWTGFTVVAKNSEGESLLRDLAAYLSERADPGLASATSPD